MSFSSSIKIFLDKHIKEGKKKFIIYPYGKIGQEVKRTLNDYFGIKEIMVLDNRKEIPGGGGVEYLDSHLPDSDTYIILATIYPSFYESCLVIAKKYFKDEQILSVYSPLAVHDKYCKDRLQERGFDFDNCIYKLSFTDIKFYLPLWNKDDMQKFVYLNDSFYDMEALVYLKHKFSDRIKGRTILDIGANVGNHSLYFAHYLKPEKIYAFEAMSDTYAILEKNIKINELSECICGINAGVGEKQSKGTITFRDISNIGSTSIAEDVAGNIDIVAIDDFSWISNIGLMKIDVEGFEAKVIRGAKNTISKYKPIIMIEIFEESSNFDEIYLFFSRLGYTVEAINEDNYFFWVP